MSQTKSNSCNNSPALGSQSPSLGSAAANSNPIKDLIYCPITRRIMCDPVVTALGDTFEREAIEEWLCRRQTNPTTGEQLPNANLSFNKTVKQMIDVFLETNPSYALNLDERYVTNKMTDKLREFFDSNDCYGLSYYLSNNQYLQLYTEFSCFPIMIKNMSSYLDDGNIMHLLCECPSSEPKILKSLIESLQKLESAKSEELSSLKQLAKNSLFATNSRGLQPIHTACFFNESEELFRELVRLQDEYSTQYETSTISLQHENLDPRCKKNMYLLMFKLIITSTPHNSLSTKSYETVEKEQALNEKCMDFIFDKMGLSGEQLSRITHQGVSLINYACKYNRLHLVKKMIEKSNLNVNHHVDSYYHTPLTSAVLGGAFSVVKYLVDETKVDVEAANDNNTESADSSRRDFPSALHLAVLRGHFDIAHFLISRGANMNALCKMSTSNGSSIEASDPMVNKALFGNRHGLDSSFGVVSSSSTSTACGAAKEDREEVHNLLTLCLLLCTDKQEISKKTLDFMNSLISKHNYKPTFPSTNTTITMNEPIWFAIRTISNKQGCDQLFDWILNHFYSDRQKLSTLRDKNKNNMLHWIAAYGRVEMMECVISYLSEDSTMDVHTLMNQKNLGGDTPLHIASQLGKKDICTKLIDLGADIRVRNMKLQDPLSATFVGSANSSLTAQFRIAFLKDLRKAVENRESGKTILSMQAKIRMLERKLSETKLVESPMMSPFNMANIDP